MNRGLIITFKIKVVVTILIWCIPFLTFSKRLFQMLGLFDSSFSGIYIRLLGNAALALVFVYILGIRKLYRGEKPASAIIAGIVSNGGTSIILFIYSLSGIWKPETLFSSIMILGSAVITFFIALSLFFFGVVKNNERELEQY